MLTRGLAASIAFLVAVSAPAQSRSFLVGVLRTDGIIIPFAAFDGNAWRPAWTEPQQDIEVPVNIASVPKGWWGRVAPAATWQAWFVDRRVPQTLHVRQPDVVPANCLRQIGLRTDYRSDEALEPFGDHPYPKAGLAVSQPQIVEPVEMVPKTAPEWKEFGPVVTQAFNRQERIVIDHDTNDEDHPLPEKKREAITPAIEAIYAYGHDPRVYVVEAAREYWSDPGPKSTCKALAFGRIWLRRDASGVKPIDATVAIQRCDREDTIFMLPLGILHVGGRTFWAAQFAGWDEERYDIIEVGSKGVLAVVRRFGGWC